MKRKAILFLVVLACLNLFNVDMTMASTSDLVISEIMYDALGSDSQKEWVEVYNAGSDQIEVLTGTSHSAWRFWDGANHALNLAQGTSTIASQEYFILASDGQQFLVDHPSTTVTVFDTVMSLPNSSSTIALSFDGGATQNITASYDSAWGASGDGKTLEKINMTQDSGQTNWQASYLAGGTPGLANSQKPADDSADGDNDGGDGSNPPPADPTPPSSVGGGTGNNWSQIKVSEFLPNPVGSDDNEWIELYNVGPQNVDLSGFKLQDNSARVFALEESNNLNLSLVNNGYLLLYKSLTGINLNNTGGDSVKLYDPGGGLLESVSYTGSAPEGKSYARQNDTFVWTATPSPGAANIIVANQAPQAKILVKTEKLFSGEKIILSASESSDPEEGELKYLWDFGDDSSGDEVTENHTYAAAGNYLVKLKVTDSGGLSNEVTSMLNVLDKSPELKLVQLQPINFTPNDLIISEFLPDPVGSDDGEWVEIFNASGQDINLAGWQLDDVEGGSRPYIFNASSTIMAGQFLVLDKIITKITLNNQSDEVRLLTPLGEVWQAVSYEKIAEGKSQAWDPINQEWFIADQPTPAAPNSSSDQVLSMANVDSSEFKDKQLVNFTGIALGPSSTSTKAVYLVSNLGGDADFTNVIAVDLASKKWPAIKRGDLVNVSGQVSKKNEATTIKIKQASDISVLDSKQDLGQPENVEAVDLADAYLNQYLTVHGLVVKIIGRNIYLASSIDDEPIVRLAPIFATKDLSIKKGTEVLATGVLSKTDDNLKLTILQPSDLALSREVLGVKDEVSSSTIVAPVSGRAEKSKKIFIYVGAVLLLVGGIYLWKLRQG